MNKYIHDLPALFRTKERIHLLRAILAAPACTVQQVTAGTGLSKGLVSLYLAMLEREGLLERNGREYRQKVSPLTAAIKRVLNIDLVTTAFRKPAWASGIGIYGSWADGTNTDESDIDLWVYVKTLPPGIAVAKLEQNVSRALSADVHILVLTKEKTAGIRNTDQPFYRSFMKQSITLEGESPDTA